MVILTATEHNDLIKTRRSLYIASVFTLLVANAQFSGDYVAALGLKVHFVPRDLVALGRFSVALLLWVFLLHTMTQVFSATSGIAKTWLERWEKAARNEIAEMENRNRDDYGREPETWELWFSEEYEKKSRLVTYFARSELLFETLKNGLIGYFLVISLSVLALWWPTSLSSVIESFRIAEDHIEISEPASLEGNDGFLSPTISGE